MTGASAWDLGCQPGSWVLPHAEVAWAVNSLLAALLQSAQTQQGAT